jgi:hypothetical protein
MSFRPHLFAMPAAFILATGLSITSPARALDGGLESGFDDGLELAQATPPAPPAPPAGSVDRPRGERSFSPRAVCQDHVARRIGNRAYIKARLELKPEQMNAWTAFEKAADEASTKAMTRCASLPTEMKERPTYIDRMTMMEDWMKDRVASIEAVKPTLTALYNVLSPEQKAMLDRPRGGMGDRMGGHMHGGPGPR